MPYILLLLIMVFTNAPAYGSSFSKESPARIHMVVWRGCEDACRSFSRFFLDRDLPVDITVTDVARDTSLLPHIQQKIRAENPDLVVTWGTSVSSGIIGTIDEFGNSSAIGEIPALFMIVADPVRSGIVASYSGSGRNFVAGVRNRVPEETQLALIRQYLDFEHVGVIMHPEEPNSVVNLERLQELAIEQDFKLTALRYTVDAVGVASPLEIPAVMARLADEEVDAVYVGSSSFNLEHSDAFTAAAVELGLPVFTAYASMVQDSGALMAVANAYANVGKLAAAQTFKILFEGIEPSRLPIETLSRFSIFINLRTAADLDIYPPIQLLSIAHVIE